MSDGWHSKTLHINSSVEKRIALALLVFSIERLAIVIFTFSDNSESEIFLLAIITSRLTIIGMAILLIRFHVSIVHLL